MLKIFYHPIYFRLKKFGMAKAMISSTLIIFVFNWLLHSYQWFWILGDYSIRLTDVLFWGLFGILVALNVVWQLRGKKKKKKKPNKNFAYFQIHASKIVGTFSVIALLWSIWVSLSVADWLGTMQVALDASLQEYLIVFLGIIAVIFILGFVLYIQEKQSLLVSNFEKKWNRLKPVLALLFLLGLSGISLGASQLDSFLDQKDKMASIETFKINRLNTQNEEQQFLGYYEEMLTPRDISSNLWQEKKIENKEKIENIDTKLNFTRTEDYLLRNYSPNIKGNHKGGLVEINSWGFRDKQYELLPRDSNLFFILKEATLLRIPIINMTDAYKEVTDLNSLIIMQGDSHPNEKGHQLLADRFYDELKLILKRYDK